MTSVFETRRILETRIVSLDNKDCLFWKAFIQVCSI